MHHLPRSPGRDQPRHALGPGLGVQSLEIRIHQGALSLLGGNSIRLILSEFTLNSGDTQHTYLQDLRSFLEPYGFNLVVFCDQAIWSDPRRLGYGNARFALSI